MFSMFFCATIGIILLLVISVVVLIIVSDVYGIAPRTLWWVVIIIGGIAIGMTVTSFVVFMIYG